MSVPRVLDVISEDALRFFLQGFYRKTQLSVSIYVGGERELPIFNESDCHEVCRDMRRSDNPDGCLGRNVGLAKRVLESHDDHALEELRQCPLGLRHWAEAIEHRESGRYVAVIYFGGVVTSARGLGQFSAELRDQIYMRPEDFRSGKKQFREFAVRLQRYYNSYVQMMDYVEDREVLVAHRGFDRLFRELAQSISGDLDTAFDVILRSLNSWTRSELGALCIFDVKDAEGDRTDGFLAVRRTSGMDELQKDSGENLYGPETFSLEQSFLAEAIRSGKPMYKEDIVPTDFMWHKAVAKQNARRVLALPLIPPEARYPLGALICFPGRDIWDIELRILERFAETIAVIVHLAARNELLRRGEVFRDGLLQKSRMTREQLFGEEDLAELVQNALNAGAASIFIVDPAGGNLRLLGTTDKSSEAQALLGKAVYKLGEGITGFVAAQKGEGPYAEIVYDLYADPRRSSNFEEQVPETRSGKHSLIATQILSPHGDVLGVIRCVDVQSESEAFFNSFNHFYLEGLRFWAGIIGLIHTMKQTMKSNHRFVLAFIHELASSLGGLINATILAKSYFDKHDRTKGLVKLEDTVTIGEVLSLLLDDMMLASLSLAGEEFEIKPPEFEWWWLEKDFLMPIKNAHQDTALRDRGVGISYEPIGVQLHVDRKQIMQVFNNLIRNAIKYSYDPNAPDFDKRATSDIQVVARTGEYNRLCIDFINKGLPIVSGEEEVIFRPFRKGKKAGALSVGGLGLGLYISRSIMRNHEGDIHVRSLKEPTIITLWLPSYRVRRSGKRGG